MAASPDAWRKLDAFVTGKLPGWMWPEVGELLESAPDGTVFVNVTGKIVVVNSQTETLFCYARQKLIGQPVEMLIPAHLGRLHIKHRASILAEPRVRSMAAEQELLGRRKNGTNFPVEIGLSPLRTPEGIFVTRAVRDITKRKNAKEQIQKLNAELGEALCRAERLAATGDKYGPRGRKRVEHIGEVALTA